VSPLLLFSSQESFSVQGWKRSSWMASCPLKSMFASWSSVFWQPLIRIISIPSPKRLKNQIFFMVIQKKVKEIHFHYAFFDRNCKDKVRKECQDVFPFLSLLFSFLSLELCRP
jgi:hypothetical protein